MGSLMRQYWLPAVRTDELPEPDCPPVRIRLLSENLIAFRTSSGKVGLIGNHCPHRGASLFYGRNEEDGLRCVYHGWKYDITGQCVDMPSEPPESTFKSKVKATAYPCEERGGIVWTYMGPRETPPPLPDLESNMVAANVVTQQIECNWVQAMENNMDTSHGNFLHLGAVDFNNGSALADAFLKDQTFKYMISQEPLTFLLFDTETGASYAAQRPAEKDTYYYRIMNYHFPSYTQSPTNKIETACDYTAEVPIDDTHTMQWIMTSPDPRKPSGGHGRTLPNTTEWLGRFRPEVNSANDMEIDRHVQRYDRTLDGYTGIQGIENQDRGITESQGDIQDRSTEHLGSTDAMVIKVRRLLISAAKALDEEGTVPPGVDRPEAYRRRSGTIVLPKEVDVWEATKVLREAFKGVVV
ncbi:MAG: Phenylpropionate dioxygenase, large terminal subunit [Chloroflexi bacterium]|jgi:phenylpropionate dioxygenase-like ring-hydroxylating dioxygenase large terminal subunit|nr:MAG: Phenylpropionate dioxygenase, large terminal subunit [Chloroflexota bacterium]